MSELPFDSADLPSPSSPQGDVPARRVLVVDDYADTRELYAVFLSMQGFEVQTAENGSDALAYAQTYAPDVILMDLSLPVLSGWDAIRTLKADPRTGDIPVIAFTGHAMASHIDRAREAGADDFATKPCVPQEVEQKIRNLLKGAPLHTGEEG
jgi:CheY-like chemotaxis protein